VTVDDRTAVILDTTAAAQELIAGLISEPWGQVSPSVYETGRLVTLTPWLTGHVQRIEFLLASQRPDGGWGAPQIGYALVPTLSATEGILAALRRHGPDPRLRSAADRGLRLLFRWLNGGAELTFPDMPAVELISPYLIALINEHLDSMPGEWQEGERLKPSADMDGAVLTLIRERLVAGANLPEKLLHALEIVGDAARGLPTIRTEPTGTIGASPAATAAWLGDREPSDPSNPARWHLETVVARHGGPVPCGLPITVFERAWVLSGLIRAGIPVSVPPELVLSLTTQLGPLGASAAAGLPADADTTSGALYALALLGAPHSPDLLWAYETETHFCTWPGEQGLSVSTNAHVLDAFGEYSSLRPDSAARYTATIAKVSAWLCDRQLADGSWQDRWHVSPYYATASSALALDRHGGPESAEAVRSALRWLLATQRADGSWGLWEGTAEETAYALQVLLLTRPASNPAYEEVVARGHASLLRSADRTDQPALWHDKDLYLPTAIVRGTVLAALHLAQRPIVGSGR
jgi:halimadienyl-diphosphate synthase